MPRKSPPAAASLAPDVAAFLEVPYVNRILVHTVALGQAIDRYANNLAPWDDIMEAFKNLDEAVAEAWVTVQRALTSETEP
mgnify:CR=1 FL=1